MARKKAATPALTNPSFDDLVDAVDELASGGPPGRDFKYVRLDLPVKPMPAPRPKATRDGVLYHERAYLTWRGEVARYFSKLEPRIEDVRVAVVLELVLPPYKTVSTPFAKGDNDNYEKAIWDVITKKGHIWKDDIQVCLNITLKRFADEGEEPHAKAYIREWH